jgi:2-oxoglutarate/2-oxoacid ferredoxin oxidoreductase subunit alpha
VFVLSDLDLGMNNWMSDPFEYPDAPWDRGKVLDDEALAKLPKFERYRDVDGDAIPWRTLPGVKDPKGVFFTRGSGHDEAARYTESAEVYPRLMERLARKHETARGLVPAPRIDEVERAEVGLIAFGSTHWAIVESRDELAAQGTPTGYLLLRALPFSPEVERFVARYPRVYVVEQNRDGQVADLLRSDLPDLAGRIRSVRHFTGLPIPAGFVTGEILAQEQASPRKKGERVVEGAAR